MTNTNFKSKIFSKAAALRINETVENVFPLFGAFEERKWSKGWDPILIYPDTEIIEEGTTFKTKGNRHEEPEFIWRVSKYEPENFLIQYLVSTENRYWTIKIKCNPIAGDKTSATIKYTFIGLNDKGNKINEESLQRMYQNNLKDWEEGINSYLKDIRQT